MTIWILLTIIFVVAIIPFVVWGIISKWDDTPLIAFWTCVVCIIASGAIAVTQHVSVRSEMVRQHKERQQILYQIQHMTANNDKVKLNEWILTYNDWVNDVTTSKELYGWFSWYANADMSEHTTIELV